MNNTQERLTQCFANVLPDLPVADISGASAESLAAWDSVAHITLLSAISEEFGVEFEVEDYEELTSYAAILAYLEGKSATGSVPN
jgi:acyl carrier protein